MQAKPSDNCDSLLSLRDLEWLKKLPHQNPPKKLQQNTPTVYDAPLMKIGLIGYGKMGKKVEELATKRGHTISSILTSKRTPSPKADILIDFSTPDAVIDNIRLAAHLKTPIVVGTTGWYDKLKTAETLVKEANTALLYAANFSIGVHLFLRLAKEAARLYKDYDIAGVETHHKEKKDAPSGTALAIEKATGRSVPFSSIRVGSVPGTHTLIFDSPIDQVTLTHEARGRDGFANGAVIAAEWLVGKKGIFTIEDLF